MVQELQDLDWACHTCQQNILNAVHFSWYSSHSLYIYRHNFMQFWWRLPCSEVFSTQEAVSLLGLSYSLQNLLGDTTMDPVIVPAPSVQTLPQIFQSMLLRAKWVSRQQITSASVVLVGSSLQKVNRHWTVQSAQFLINTSNKATLVKSVDLSNCMD